MKDTLSYTYDGLERELNLLEIHLKEAPKGDEAFCKDCIDKHISTSRGFALEGPSFTQNKSEQKKFLEAEKKLREIKGKDYKKHGVEYAQKVRNIRKNLFEECPTCTINSPKGLNNPANFNNYTYNSNHISGDTKLNGENKEMAKIGKAMVELGVYNAGQFAAEGAKWLIETKLAAQEPYVSLGGGVGLQVLGLFLKKPEFVKKLLIVTGSNLLAYGVIKLFKPAPIVAARAGVTRAVANVGGNVGKFTGRPNGRVFGGPVTATNIPTQYARSGIEAGAQAFEAPEHADLIRVD